MNNNKNSRDLGNPESINEIIKLSNKEKQNPSHKAQNISEEKKNQMREKNKLQMQKKRASLSEEQKEQLREKERIKRQQQRANLSDENRERLNQNNKLFFNNLRLKINENVDDDEEDEDEDQHQQEQQNRDFVAADRAKDWTAYREKRYAQSRIYKKARLAQLKDAEVKLLKAAENSTSDSDIQQLQQLATRRQQILAYGREYGKTYRQNHHRRPWVPIQQVWDEDNPCRYNIIF